MLLKVVLFMVILLLRCLAVGTGTGVVVDDTDLDLLVMELFRLNRGMFVRLLNFSIHPSEKLGK
jgi:hypothetical protein